MDKTSKPKIDSPNLVEDLQRGDHEAFRQLVGQYWNKAYKLAFRYLQNTADAEDAVQNAFLSIFLHIKDFRSQSALKTWMYKIVTNAALMKLRERRRLKNWKGQLEDCMDFVDEIPDNRHRPQDIQAHYARLAKNTLGVISDLSSPQREIVVPYFLDEEPPAIIAKDKGLTTETVKSRIHKAKLKLRKKITKVVHGKI